jgi:hypothetical protein
MSPLYGASHHRLESLWADSQFFARAGEACSKRKIMSVWDIGIRSGDRQPLPRAETGRRVASREADRSPAPALRETVRSLGGLLFFVVAVMLLLYGTRFI